MAGTLERHAGPPGSSPGSKRYAFRLYVFGKGPVSRLARENLAVLCERHFPGQSEIEIVDLAADPDRARADDIFAIPTLIKLRPGPAARLIGDLSRAEEVMRELHLLD
jgi:circadian clock protein KaiB